MLRRVCAGAQGTQRQPPTAARALTSKDLVASRRGEIVPVLLNCGGYGNYASVARQSQRVHWPVARTPAQSPAPSPGFCSGPVWSSATDKKSICIPREMRASRYRCICERGTCKCHFVRARTTRYRQRHKTDRLSTNAWNAWVGLSAVCRDRASQVNERRCLPLRLASDMRMRFTWMPERKRELARSLL